MVWYKTNINLRYKYICFKLTVIAMRYYLAETLLYIYDINNGLVN